jgi:hypothetical protein
MDGTTVAQLEGEGLLFWNTGKVKPGMYLITILSQDKSLQTPVLVVK